MERYVTKENKKLRFGFTTGSAATLATKAALHYMFEREKLEKVSIMTPKGWEVTTEVVECYQEGQWFKASVLKDAGDDPDVTHGTKISAKVKYANSGESTLDGGIGVGRVTKEGLQVPVGQAAINPVPRQMINQVIEDFADEPVDVVIEIPDGERLAKKTFNPQLGILGGISIIGTSGIVEPMSKKAIIDTIITELKVLKAQGVEDLILVPGNHGMEEAKKLGLSVEHAVKISNFVGEALDACLEMKFSSVTLVGHVGKFVKLSLGIFQTHSREADGRMASLIYHLVKLKAPLELLSSIDQEVTVEGACKKIIDAGYREVFNVLCDQAKNYVEKRTYGELSVAIYMYSFDHGVLGRSKHGND